MNCPQKQPEPISETPPTHAEAPDVYATFGGTPKNSMQARLCILPRATLMTCALGMAANSAVLLATLAVSASLAAMGDLLGNCMKNDVALSWCVARIRSCGPWPVTLQTMSAKYWRCCSDPARGCVNNVIASYLQLRQHVGDLAHDNCQEFSLACLIVCEKVFMDSLLSL